MAWLLFYLLSHLAITPRPLSKPGKLGFGPAGGSGKISKINKILGEEAPPWFLLPGE
jgi:hypothetical protein